MLTKNKQFVPHPGKQTDDAFNEIPGSFDNEKTTEEPEKKTEELPF